MASLHMSQALGQSHNTHHNSSGTSSNSNSNPNFNTNIFKSRSRTVVKPILKKWQSSHSEKNSLDLDRAWQDQNLDFGTHSRDDDSDPSAAVYAGAVSTAGTSRTPRDVTFTLSATDLPSLGARPPQYSHARSTSGASHGSIATAGSGRNGSFVHPFQQIPRTSTPPLSYANSFVSLDNAPAASREFSPTIAEFESDTDSKTYAARPSRSHQPPPSLSDLRRPSLASQRTSSLTDVNQAVRMVNTRSSNGNTSSAAHSPGLGVSVNHSRSDFHPVTSPSFSDGPLSSTAPLCSSPPSVTSPSLSSSNPISPLRSSLDMTGFRLRSRSELDAATRQEQVRQARRKFEEKEKVKEEKYAREQVRKREKADNKEAQRFERAQAQMRSRTSLSNGLASGRNSTSTDARPSGSRKSTSNSRIDAAAEKVDFASRGYDSTAQGQTPHARADDVHFQHTRRSNTAKRKTTGAWTAFVLWLRTRLLKLGRR